MDKDYRGSGHAPTFAESDSIVTASRHDHSRMRRTLTHAFSEKALREQEALIGKYVDLMILRLKDKYLEGAQDIVKWIFVFGNLLSFIGFLASGRSTRGVTVTGLVSPDLPLWWMKEEEKEKKSYKCLHFIELDTSVNSFADYAGLSNWDRDWYTAHGPISPTRRNRSCPPSIYCSRS